MSRSLLVAAALVATSASLARAQGIPFSQHGEVSQRVAFTDITISYNRPTARGRVIYGDSAIVRWGRVWNPGADSASRITFSRAVTVEGKPVDAGSYSLW